MVRKLHQDPDSLTDHLLQMAAILPGCSVNASPFYHESEVFQPF
jgi:hypothetical protein